MAVTKKISNTELYGTFEGNVVVKKITISTKIIDGEEVEMAELSILWNQSRLFVFDEQKLMIKKIAALKVGDIIFIRGRLENKWFPGAKPFTNINKLFKLNKIGVKS